jgi:histidinol dehydrogenase
MEFARQELLTVSVKGAMEAALARQLAPLPRGNIAGESWNLNGAVIVLRSLDEASALADKIAAEQLEISCANPMPLH